MGGGGGDLNVPKAIWSPAGGFYADPKHWKRNTVVCIAAMLAITVPLFYKSVSSERRHAMPTGKLFSERFYTAKNWPAPKAE